MIYFPFIIVRTFPNIPNLNLKLAFDGYELPVGIYTFSMVGDKEDFEFTDYLRNFIGIGIIWITKEGIRHFFVEDIAHGRKIIRAFHLDEHTVAIAAELASRPDISDVNLIIVDIIGSRDAVEVGLIDEIFNYLKNTLGIRPIEEIYRLGKDQVVRIRITMIGGKEHAGFIIGEFQRMCTGMGLHCVGLGKADFLRVPPGPIAKEIARSLGWTPKDLLEITGWPHGRETSAVKIQYGFAKIEELSEHNINQILEFVDWVQQYARGVVSVPGGRPGEYKKVTTYYRSAKVEIATIMEYELFPFFTACAWSARLLALELSRYFSPSTASRILRIIELFDKLIATLRFGRLSAAIAVAFGVSAIEFILSIAVMMLIESLINYIKSQLESITSWGGG